VKARVPGRIDDRVAAVRVELAERLVRELSAVDHRSALQLELTEVEDLVVRRELAHSTADPLEVASERNYFSR
jgi:hypothetical protein